MAVKHSIQCVTVDDTLMICSTIVMIDLSRCCCVSIKKVGWLVISYRQHYFKCHLRIRFGAAILHFIFTRQRRKEWECGWTVSASHRPYHHTWSELWSQQKRHILWNSKTPYCVPSGSGLFDALLLCGMLVIGWWKVVWLGQSPAKYCGQPVGFIHNRIKVGPQSLGSRSF